MSASSSHVLDSKDAGKFNESRATTTTRQQVDKHFANMAFLMELSDSPEESLKKDDFVPAIVPDWHLYNYMDAARKSHMSRYRIPDEYQSTMHDIDIHVAHAFDRRKCNASPPTPLLEWLENLGASTNCPLEYTRRTHDFSQRTFASLVFRSHEYEVRLAPKFKLYMITVGNDVDIARMRVFDYFYFYAV